GRPYKRHLDHPRLALDAGYGHIPREVDPVSEQNPKRRARERDIARLIELRVVEDNEPMPRDEQERARWVVLEPHPPRALQPRGPATGRAVRGHLEETGF